MSRSKESRKRNHRMRKERAARFLMSLRQSVACICGEDRPECLDFHHLGDKDFHLSKAAQRGWSIETINAELKKCVILCANCHRVMHSRGA